MQQGINLKNVSFAYKGSNAILRDISLNITKGEFLAVIGVNGSGKSTFSFLLNGLIPHLVKGKLEGSVAVDGIETRDKPVAFFAQKVGLVFQNPDFSLFNLTVAEEIEFGLRNFGLKNDSIRVENALEQVGLPHYKERDPHSLSVGEKQKISIACLLALEPSYLVLDEPVAQLDYRSSIHIYQILQRLNKLGKTIIVIEHDSDFVWKYSDHTVILDKGKVISSGNTHNILSDTKLLRGLGLKTPNKKT